MPETRALTSRQRLVLRAFTTEVGVQVFGPIHGGAFIAYLVLSVVAWRSLRWSWGTLLTALVCSVPPLFTVVFELWAARTGRLTPTRTRQPALV